MFAIWDKRNKRWLDCDGDEVVLYRTEAAAKSVLACMDKSRDFEVRRSEFVPDAVVRELVSAIDNTGGVVVTEDNETVPVADEEWVDLGAVYVQACELLGREPLIVEESEVECEDCGYSGSKRSFSDDDGDRCPKCGSFDVG